MSPTHCDNIISVYCDIMGQWYGTFYFLLSGYYYIYYKEIVHNISDENKGL